MSRFAPRASEPLQRLSVGRWMAAALLGGAVLSSWAQPVRCHVTYGGHTRAFAVPEVSEAYDAPFQAEGSYFMFRAVNQTRPIDLASVKVYVYAAQDNGPRLLHQGTWLAAQTPQSGSRTPHGFTGLQTVYEPLRDGELHYWCERLNTP